MNLGGGNKCLNYLVFSSLVKRFFQGHLVAGSWQRQVACSGTHFAVVLKENQLTQCSIYPTEPSHTQLIGGRGVVYRSSQYLGPTAHA